MRRIKNERPKHMKILFFTQDIPYPVTSGHHVRTFHYLKPLIREHQVTIATFGDPAADEKGLAHFKEAGADVQLLGPKRVFNKLQRMTAVLRALWTPLPYSVHMRFDPILREKLARVYTAGLFDLLICDGIHLSLNLSENIQCRKILDEHNVESVVIKRYVETQKNILKKFYAWLEYIKFVQYENSVWPRFNELHVCSDVDRKQVLERIKGPEVRVVPNPVDTDQFKPREVKERPCSLVYTGLMGWTPNIDAATYFAAEIYPLIKVKIADVHFSIIGKNPAPSVKALAQTDPSITVLGYVDDIAAHICEGAVFVVPLRIGSGTRLKILEAMALGKAIVSTTIGCEGLDVTNTENILIADTPDDFAAAVIRLLQDPNLRAKLGQNGRKLAEEQYSATKMGADLLNFINLFTTGDSKNLCPRT